MRRTTIPIIKDLATRLRNPDQPRPLLFLGAGCSIAAGLPDQRGLLKHFGASSLGNLYDRLRNPIELQAAISERFSPSPDSSAHDLLAFLVAKGFFDTILTVNWDYLLETSLSKLLSPKEYRVFVRPQIPDDIIAQALQSELPRVKVVKLHGEELYRPILKPTELMRFHKDLTLELERLAEQRGLVVIGYGLEEPRFFRILGDAYVTVVDPADPGPDKLAQFGSGAKHVGGEEGDFGTFMQCLCSELLPAEYRELLPPPPTVAGAHHPVAPPPDRQGEVDELCEPVDDWIEHHNLSRGEVEHLTKKLLTQIRDKFNGELLNGNDGVCLVFVKDSMAPGGTEIYRLVDLNNDLKQLTYKMEIQSLEITVRYGAERRVVSWDGEEGGSDLSRFGAVVLIDSVSFSGNTLELARDYLHRKGGGRPKDRFTAALLVLPKEAEKRLRSGDAALAVTGDRHRWWDVISPLPNYPGFDVTFPWGWTTATLPLEGRRFTEADTFIPSREFSYIPKPWGEQLVFSKDEKVTVSLLVLERGQRTSTHYHLLRTETFVVLDGRMRLCLWDKYFELQRNESIRIPPGVPHALIALDQACRVLEIASGPYDLARDIVRIVENYVRRKNPDGSDDGLR